MDSSPTKPIEQTSPEKPTPLWIKRLPMITGVLAGLAGFLTVKQSNLSNDAIYRSNQAVLFQAKASDAWAEYQANSVKKHIDIAAIRTAADPVVKQELETESKALLDRQGPLGDQAKDREMSRDNELRQGQARLEEKDMLSYAGVTAQLAIALASVAALTRSKAAFHVCVGAGALGILITGYAILGEILRHFHPV